MSSGNQHDWTPGYDYTKDLQWVGIKAGTLSTTSVPPDITTVTGTLSLTPPDITTVSYASTPAVGITGGTIAATQSGVWNVGINSGAQVAIASVNGNIGVSGNVGATQSGAWAVGVSGGNIAATQSGAWTVGVSSGNLTATLSTGTAAIGGVYPISGLVMNERAQIVPGSISYVNATTSGHLAVIGAQGSGVAIRVLSAHVMSRGYSDIAFLSGPSGTGSTITATLPMPSYGGFVWPFNPQGWCETGPNAALTFYQATATNTGVQVTWATVS